jgi:hypothetical protein
MESPFEFRDYDATVTLSFTSTDRSEAWATLVRSGLVGGNLIGECMVTDVDLHGYGQSADDNNYPNIDSGAHQ